MAKDLEVGDVVVAADCALRISQQVGKQEFITKAQKVIDLALDTLVSKLGG